MSTISKKIEIYLKLLLREADNNMIEVQRNALAEYFQCVPSQINYVLSTRFTSDRGYMIETRRGGGGFVRIKKIDLGLKEKMTKYHIDGLNRPDNYDAIFERLFEEDFLTKRESLLLRSVFNTPSFKTFCETKKAAKIREDMFREVVNAITKF